MSNQQQLNVPAQLIEELGTGEDKLGLIGKRIRVTVDPMEGAPAIIRAIVGVPPTPVGAEGVVVHVDSEGTIWADFGDNEDIPRHGADQDNDPRVWDIGNNDDAEEDRTYEVLN